MKCFTIFQIIPMGQYKMTIFFYFCSYLGCQLNSEEGSTVPSPEGSRSNQRFVNIILYK